MDLEKYDVTVSADFSTFRFTSNGTNGFIDKAIKYRVTSSPIVYNLAFGDITRIDEETGEIYIDDIIESKNGDFEKVIATVASSAYIFTEKYPEKILLLRGSTNTRTRLYRMSINKYFDEISETFDIFGAIYMGEIISPCPYDNKGEFIGFFIKRK